MNLPYATPGEYTSKGYDFNFDFRSDATLVCSELVNKAYEPSSNMSGLKFFVCQILGRLAPPNNIAKQFDDELGTPSQQMDFVYFLDGHEGSRRAQIASIDEFRNSWRRPKWHLIKIVLLDDTPK